MPLPGANDNGAFLPYRNGSTSGFKQQVVLTGGGLRDVRVKTRIRVRVRVRIRIRVRVMTWIRVRATIRIRIRV